MGQTMGGIQHTRSVAFQCQKKTFPSGGILATTKKNRLCHHLKCKVGSSSSSELYSKARNMAREGKSRTTDDPGKNDAKQASR